MPKDIGDGEPVGAIGDSSFVVVAGAWLPHVTTLLGEFMLIEFTEFTLGLPVTTASPEADPGDGVAAPPSPGDPVGGLPERAGRSGRPYASRGVFDVGGTFSLDVENTTSTEAMDVWLAFGATLPHQTTAVTLGPRLGWFLFDRVELLGALSLTASDTKTTLEDGGIDEWASHEFTFDAGATYELPVLGNFAVGPEILVGYAANGGEAAWPYSSSTTNAGSFDATGPDLRLGGNAKVIVGQATIGLDAYYEVELLTVTESETSPDQGFASGSNTTTHLVTAVTGSYFF